MPDLVVASPCQLTEELASDARFRLHRGRIAGRDGTVLIKLPALAPSFADDLARLKREYEILSDPPVDSVTRALDLVCNDQHCALVLEDCDDRPLAALIAARSAPLGWVLDYALQIAATLAGLHAAGIIHRALSPRSVLVHERSGRVRLTDFSDAARDAAEACAPLAEHQYRTRLPYAAPEQTGRVNRACDWRTDFYALGALLYELLVGHPPFVSDDPLELMHAQIARTPPAPASVATVPLPLSRIVMKLLAKQPEERYQSAHGLQQDLQRCRREWSERGRIADFPIAAADVSDRFAVPQRLYGRDAERAALIGAFDVACHGPTTLLLVEGAAGIGKTALIQALHEPVARSRGNFVSGKFDQLSRDVPYAALVQALRQCVQRLLAEAPARLARDVARLGASLGPNAAVIAEVIPEIELILGPQRPAPPLPPAEAQNRFTLAFQNFVAALATAEAPLAIFLDDLQWADSSTLQLLRALATSAQIRHLLLIGAWRAHEVDAAHPLARALDSLQSEAVAIRRIALGPLALPALTELAADTLHAERNRAEPLARLLLERTGGNPFFVTQTLAALHREGLIVFDPQRCAWTCRLDAIAASAADDVGELLSRKLDRLPGATEHALALAAFLGNRFDAPTLAAVCAQPLRTTLDDLEVALAEGLIVPESNHGFAFLHDRVQQAAYARIGAFDRPRVHLHVGRTLAGDAAASGEAAGIERIFDAVSHLNLGAALIDAPAERLALARLNLAAGNRAKSAAAYRSARGYYRAGRALLAPEHWSREYEPAFALHLEAAQCDYLCGDFDAALRQYDELLQRAASALDRARVHRLRAIQFENLARYGDALAAARGGLAALGIALPVSARAKRAALAAEIAQIRARRAGRPIAALIDLPPMTDPSMQMVMKILTDAWSPAYIHGDATLARLISATLVRLSLAHGNAAESAYGYVTHAISAGPVNGDYGEAWEWGNLALAVNERLDDRRLRAKVYQQFHAHVNLWCRPFASWLDYAKAACRAGLENGDFLYAAYGASTEAWPAFAAAQDLARFNSDLQPNLELLARLKNDSFADALRLMLAWSLALQGATDAPRLSHPDFDEDRYAAAYRGNAFFSMFHAIARLHVCFLLGDTEGAAQAACAVQGAASELVGMQWSVLYAFWNGLRLADAHAAADAVERAAALKTLRAARRELDALADRCPENFRCWALILSAELARITGQPLRALDLYERAIAFADETANVQQRALTNERCGRLWLERGNRTVAAVYLRAARDCYAQWGAHAKVRQLAQQHGALLGAGAPAVPAHAAESLDRATIGRAAQALAADVELDTLIRQMLRIAIQSAGASRGALVEVLDDGAHVVAAGGTESDDGIELHDAPMEAPPHLCSAAVVNYVLRTQAALVLTDPLHDERFARDPYLDAAQPRSVLCLPIVQQGGARAALYLENSLVRDAFRPEGIEVIQILAAQAAVSLHSARLLDRMTREMHERQRAEQRLRAIEAGTATVTGGDFFRALVRNLAQALEVRYVFVAECLRDDPKRGRIVRTRAFWNGDDFGEGFEFALPGTPCQQVVDGEVCHYADDLQARFPQDVGLADWNAHSYLGMPLVSSGGQVIGHVALVGTAPMPDATLALAVLRLSAGRAAAELERLRAHEGLQRALAEVEQLKNRLQEENVYLRRELIANVSHDLRSPLASLRGYLDTLLLKEQSLGAQERRSFLTIAQRQAEHLQTLISELFDLARLDFDGYRIDAEPVALGELARDVLQKFQLAAQGRHVQLALELDDALGFVHADIGLLERTLENLLENALAHTPPDGRVTLAVLAHDDGALVEVRDTGSGIPPDDLPHIFERFYRVDKARTLASSGSGLGLAIVKRIVELHGSQIHVDSSVGAGTRFWFTLKTAAPAAH